MLQEARTLAQVLWGYHCPNALNKELIPFNPQHMFTPAIIGFISVLHPNVRQIQVLPCLPRDKVEDTYM